MSAELSFLAAWQDVGLLSKDLLGNSHPGFALPGGGRTPPVPELVCREVAVVGTQDGMALLQARYAGRACRALGAP